MNTDKLLEMLLEAIDYSFLQTNGDYDKSLTYPVIDKVKYIKEKLKNKEVKEVDLEKEIETHLKECLDVKFPTTDIELIKKDVRYTAEMFFELGLKAQKGYDCEKLYEEPQVYETEDGEIITYSESEGYKVVEPKFKVGDWVVRGNITAQILDIQEQYYIGIDTNGNDFTSSRFLSDDKIHLWTIQDTKAGDVLADEYNNIGLYRGEKDDFWESYIYLGCDNNLYGFNIGGYHEHKNTKPATKEQRDLLFQKMKEEGCEWDAEKKEVKKIEQKPTDKVEPKFKVGDWVVREYTKDIITINQVVDVKRINDEHFGYTLDDGTYFSGSWESSYHLWTIQDAKDGDILVGSKGNIILMFRGIGNTEWDDVIDYHCCYDCYHEYFIVQNGVEYWGNIENNQLKPATKEQCDLLFQKMKDVGYMLNAEKKELNKIERKPTIEMITPEESLGIDSETYNKIVDGCFYDEQKPAWSEEDEEMLENILDDYDDVTEHNLSDDIGKVTWLKSLKQRLKGE